MISFFIEKENKYFIGKENKKIPNLLVLPTSPEDWGFSILSQIINKDGGGQD